jgi:hypothetical protein
MSFTQYWKGERKPFRFASIVAKEVGLAGTDCAPAFEKAFKKRLERRLRERHRIVHAHERPSLASRLAELRQPKTDQERDALADVLGDIVAKMTMIVAQLRDQNTDEAFEALTGSEFREIHDKAFGQEASDMWKYLVSNLDTTFA